MLNSQVPPVPDNLSPEEKANLRLERNLKIIGVVTALLPFVWGLVTYGLGYKSQAESAQLQAQSTAIEVKRPFLDLQLRLYTEAVQITSYLATHPEQQKSETYRKKQERFRELYWGELGLVENGGIKSQHGGVEGAMVRFSNCLFESQCSRFNAQNELEATELTNLSLDVSHACRDSLAQSWNIEDWQTPMYTPATPEASRSPTPPK